MGRFVSRLYVRGMCSLPLMYHPVHAEKWHKWAWRGWIWVGGCWVPLDQSCQFPGMAGQGRYVNPWPIHPHTHPPTQPPIHVPPHQPFPIPPRGPNNPCPIPPPIPPTNLPTHPSTHPLTQTPTHPNTQPPTHSPLCHNNPTNPKHIYIMPNEFPYYSSTSFQDSKLMRVIWQYPNYGILNFS